MRVTCVWIAAAIWLSSSVWCQDKPDSPTKPEKKKTAPKKTDQELPKTLLFTNDQIESPYSIYSGDATAFRYHIFFSRTVGKVSLKEVSTMAVKLRQVYRDLNQTQQAMLPMEPA